MTFTDTGTQHSQVTLDGPSYFSETVSLACCVRLCVDHCAVRVDGSSLNTSICCQRTFMSASVSALDLEQMADGELIVVVYNYNVTDAEASQNKHLHINRTSRPSTVNPIFN